MGAILTRTQEWRAERMEILRYRRRILKLAFGLGPEVAAVDSEMARIHQLPAPITVHHWTRHRRELADAREKSGRDPLTGAPGVLD